MVRRGLSVRLERHIERGEELMELNRTAFERNEAAFERNAQAFERLMAAFDRFEQTSEQQQVFIRDMSRRNEVVVQQLIRDHQEFMKELTTRDEKADRGKEEASRKTEKILAELKDLREESRAQRGALLSLIDRLPPPAQAA
jgi:hypothetical protein